MATKTEEIQNSEDVETYEWKEHSAALKHEYFQELINDLNEYFNDRENYNPDCMITASLAEFNLGEDQPGFAINIPFFVPAGSSGEVRKKNIGTILLFRPGVYCDFTDNGAVWIRVTSTDNALIKQDGLIEILERSENKLEIEPELIPKNLTYVVKM